MIPTAALSAPLPPPAPSIARGDFPSWLPATLVKELRQGLRTRGFVGTFIGFQILMAILMMSVATQSLVSNAGVRAASFSMANGFFWTILTLQLIVFTPARALGSLQLEVSSRTIDLLMLTRLDAWRIVTGKWASLVAQSALLLVAMLPYGIVRYFAGSVDLVSDALQCGALLGGSALLTAAGLWGAGMGKVFRLVTIVAGVMFSGVGTSIFSAITRSTMPAGLSSLRGAQAGLLWYDGALLLVFFLVAAVRNIAPRAENHALLARSLPLLALVPVPIATLLVGASAAVSAQLIAAGIFLLLVSASELASVDLPLLVHFRAALKRAALPRVFLRMTLPGWPSAFLYLLFATMAWLACAALLGRTSGAGTALNLSLSRSIWLAVLALSALVFPALVMSLLPRVPRQAGGIYLVVLAVSASLMPIGLLFASMSPRVEFIKTVMAVVPVASFFASVVDDNIGAGQIAAQAAIAVVVICFAWWQTRSYWLHLSLLEARAQRSGL